jgi:hypothetical protein
MLMIGFLEKMVLILTRPLRRALIYLKRKRASDHPFHGTGDVLSGKTEMPEELATGRRFASQGGRGRSAVGPPAVGGGPRVARVNGSGPGTPGIEESLLTACPCSGDMDSVAA